MRGSMKPYTMSTTKFATNTAIVMSSAIAWITG